MGKPQKARVQLNACGQKIAKGQRLRLSLSNAYWPIIWPSQTDTTLTLTNTRLDLPVREPRDEDANIPEFEPPQSAQPLATERHSEPQFKRRRTVDFVTGREKNERVTDTGQETHLHTGLSVQYRNSETFDIHPDDANSATGTMRWHKSYARDDWRADVETEVVVQALRNVWRIDAKLTARDAEGIVFEHAWHEDVPRDLV